MPNNSSLKAYLDKLNVPTGVKHDAWDAFTQANSKPAFQKAFDALALPTSAKHDLWNMKFGATPIAPQNDQLQVQLNPGQIFVGAHPGEREASPILPNNQLYRLTPQGQLEASRGGVLPEQLTPQQALAAHERAVSNVVPSAIHAIQSEPLIPLMPKVSEAQELKHPVASAILKTAQGLTTPANLGFLMASGGFGATPEMAETSLGELLPRAVSTYFGGQQLAGLSVNLPKALSLLQSASPEKQALGKEMLTESALGGVIAGAALKHGVLGESARPGALPEAAEPIELAKGGGPVTPRPSFQPHLEGLESESHGVPESPGAPVSLDQSAAHQQLQFAFAPTTPGFAELPEPLAKENISVPEGERGAVGSASPTMNDVLGLLDQARVAGTRSADAGYTDEQRAAWRSRGEQLRGKAVGQFRAILGRLRPGDATKLADKLDELREHDAEQAKEIRRVLAGTQVAKGMRTLMADRAQVVPGETVEDFDENGNPVVKPLRVGESLHYDIRNRVFRDLLGQVRRPETARAGEVPNEYEGTVTPEEWGAMQSRAQEKLDELTGYLRNRIGEYAERRLLDPDLAAQNPEEVLREVLSEERSKGQNIGDEIKQLRAIVGAPKERPPQPIEYASQGAGPVAKAKPFVDEKGVVRMPARVPEYTKEFMRRIGVRESAGLEPKASDLELRARQLAALEHVARQAGQRGGEKGAIGAAPLGAEASRIMPRYTPEGQYDLDPERLFAYAKGRNDMQVTPAEMGVAEKHAGWFTPNGEWYLSLPRHLHAEGLAIALGYKDLLNGYYDSLSNGGNSAAFERKVDQIYNQAHQEGWVRKNDNGSYSIGSLHGPALDTVENDMLRDANKLGEVQGIDTFTHIDVLGKNGRATPYDVSWRDFAEHDFNLRKTLADYARRSRLRGGERGAIGEGRAPDEPAEPFYSYLERTLVGKMPKRASADQVAGLLKGAGVSKAELEWSDVDSFLRAKAERHEPVTREQLVSWVRDHNPRIEVSTTQGPSPDFIEAANEYQRKAAAYNQEYQVRAVRIITDIMRRTPDVQDRSQLSIPLREAIKDFYRGQNPDHMAHDDKWAWSKLTPEEISQLAELRDAADVNDIKFNQLEEEHNRTSRQPKYEKWKLPGGTNYRETLLRLGESPMHSPAGYKSPHWDEGDVIAHLRTTDRTDTAGRRTLFLDEIQSDWANELRRKGPPLSDEERTELTELQNQYNQNQFFNDEQLARWDELTGREAARRAAPEMPWSKGWHELALKYALFKAAREGYDQLAWTTGAQQADIYNLRHAVSRLNYDPQSETLLARPANPEEFFPKEFSVTQAELPKFVGAEMAQRLLAEPGADVEVPGPMELGGEHHIALYDRMIPQFLSRYTRKWGGNVGSTEIELPAAADADEGPQPAPETPETVGVHALPITPDMRRSVQEGQRSMGGFMPAQVGIPASLATGAAVGMHLGASLGPHMAPVAGAAGALAGGIAYAIAGHPAVEALGHDIADTARAAGVSVGHVYNELGDALMPLRHMTPQQTDALFHMKGGSDRATFIQNKVLREYDRAIEKLPRDQQLALVSAYQSGAPAPTPEFQELFNKLHTAQDQVFRMLQQYRPNLRYLEDHIGNHWKELPGGKGSGFRSWLAEMSQRRPLEGSGGMLRQRIYATLEEGIKAGGVPTTTNLVRLHLTDVAQSMRFVRANEWFEDAKPKGDAQFVQTGQRVTNQFRSEFERMRDEKLFQQYFPAASGEGLVRSGEWWVRKSIALPLKRYLGRDYLRETTLGRGLADVKNLSTMGELFGPFHFATEGVQAMAGEISAGLLNMNTSWTSHEFGRFMRGLGQVLKSPLAPVTTALRGGKYINAYTDINGFLGDPANARALARYGTPAQVVYDMFDGGLRPEAPAMLRSRFEESMKRSWHEGSPITAAAKAPAALAGYLSTLLFDRYIPALKVGQFLELRDVLLRQHADDLASGKTTRGALMRKAVSTVDNFWGEKNFDNLFWNRTVTSGLFLGYRSFTWRAGNIAGLFHAAADTARMANEGVHGVMPRLGTDVAQVMGLLMTTAAIGGLAQMALTKANTGHAKRPTSLTDLLHPQTGYTDDRGRPVRLNVPSYWSKDYPELWASGNPASGFARYVTSGQAGFFERLAEDLQNRDFYGVQVRDPNKGVFGQFVQSLAHLSVPNITWENIQRLRAEGLSTREAAGVSAAGLNPAPRSLDLSPAEKVAQQIYSTKASRGPISAQQFARRQSLSELTRALRANSPDAISIFDKGVQSGTLHPDDFSVAIQRMSQPYLVGITRGFDFKELKRVLAKATPQERQELLPAYYDAFVRAIQNGQIPANAQP